MQTFTKLVVVAASLIGVGLLGLGACASSVMVPQGTRHSDSEVTSAIQASLQANDEVTARQVEVETRGGVARLTGVVDTPQARREAGRVVWSTEGVGIVINDLTVAERTVDRRVDDVIGGL